MDQLGIEPVSTYVEYIVMVGRRVPDTTGAFSLCLNHVYITRIYGSVQGACAPWN
jgi:hypothetical protein